MWLDFIVISRRAELDGSEIERLNLLAVVWGDEEIEGMGRVAKRIGTDIINERDWVEAERGWKLVVLG